MLLLRGTFVVFSLFSSVYGFFSGYGPKPTTQTKAGSKGWGMSYIEKFKPKIPLFGLGSWGFFGETKGSATTKVSTTFPEATTQDYTLSSEDLSPKYQPTATTFEELQSRTIQIGTLLPLKSAKLPIIDLLRNKPEPPKLDPNYDLDHWPPNNGQSTAKTPRTTISKLEAQTYTDTQTQSTSTTHTTILRPITETMNPYSDQTVPTDAPSTTSELTTQTYTVSSAQNTSTMQTTTLRLITETMNPYSDQTVPSDTQATTSELTMASFQTANFISPADPMLEVSTEALTTVSARQNTLGTTNTASKPEWTSFKTTDKALDTFTWVEQTTGPSEGGRVQSFGPDPTPTLPAGGFPWEEGDKEMGKSADLTTQEQHDEPTTSASVTTLRNTEHEIPPPPEVDPNETIYRVKEILDSRQQGGRLQYLMDWEGYNPEERSWMDRVDVLDPSLLSDFHQSRPDRPAPRRRGRPRRRSQAPGDAHGGGGTVTDPSATPTLYTHSQSPDY